MRYLFLICCITISLHCFAQDTAKLREYLLTHRYTIDLNSGHAFDMLPALMKGKNLLVLGEGGSHNLELYPQLKTVILDQLANHQNLKNYFIEFGRSTAFFMNKYISREYKECQPGYDSYCYTLDKVRPAFAIGHGFEITGIDFERSKHLNRDINYLFPNPDYNVLPVSGPMLSRLKDTAYFALSRKKFQRYYRKNRRSFFKKSPAIKEELGSKYPEFSYLMTNRNTKNPGIDRNGPMARNLIKEITPLDTSSVYFLSIGMAHSIPKNRSSALHKLYKSHVLKNKVIVMNTYFEDLGTVKGMAKSGLKFMTGDIQECFSHCAGSDIVLFDLSQLPPEFAYMKKYGDMVLYTKNNNSLVK